MRRKGKRKRSQASRIERAPLGGPGQRWSLDFVHDTLSSGRSFRCLTVIDEFSREALATQVAYSIPSVRVIEVLERPEPVNTNETLGGTVLVSSVLLGPGWVDPCGGGEGGGLR